MTIIVAVKDKNDTIIGADTQASSGWDKINRRDSKVFITHGVGYGFTTSYRMGQILRFHSEFIDLSEGDPFELTVSKLVPMWRGILSTNGYTKVDNNRESGGTFIVSFRGRIFTIEGDFQVGEPRSDFAAVGCGSAYALGALYASSDREFSARERVSLAISAASEFSNGCGGDVDQIRISNAN